MTSRELCLTFKTPDATAQTAALIGKTLNRGDTILLDGDIGAGKTHFARSLIQSMLHMPEDVPSPTYTLVQTYHTNAGALWHADLYRLTDAAEIHELGLIEAFEDAICLVEWPDRLGSEVPVPALTLRLEAPHGDDRRDAVFTWQASKWDEKLKGLADG